MLANTLASTKFFVAFWRALYTSRIHDQIPLLVDDRRAQTVSDGKRPPHADSIATLVCLAALDAYRAKRQHQDVCRFEPSCSRYASEAIRRFGAVRGVRLAIARLIRCRAPYGGDDPVPLM